jgi:hypothetical protein
MESVIVCFTEFRIVSKDRFDTMLICIENASVLKIRYIFLTVALDYAT